MNIKDWIKVMAHLILGIHKMSDKSYKCAIVETWTDNGGWKKEDHRIWCVCGYNNKRLFDHLIECTDLFSSFQVK